MQMDEIALYSRSSIKYCDLIDKEDLKINDILSYVHNTYFIPLTLHQEIFSLAIYTNKLGILHHINLLFENKNTCNTQNGWVFDQMRKWGANKWEKTRGQSLRKEIENN